MELDRILSVIMASSSDESAASGAKRIVTAAA
jgi:hypothetical protein